MRRRRRWAIAVALVLLALAAAGASLLTTQSGLAWVWARAVAASGGRLQAEAVHGRLIGPIDLDGVSLRTGATRIHIGHLHLDWRLSDLFAGRLHVLDLSATRLEVRQGPKVTAGKPSKPFTGFSLPLPVQVDRAAVVGLRFISSSGAPQRLESVVLRGSLDRRRLRLAELTVAAPQGRVTLRGRAGTGPQQAVALTAAWSAKLPSGLPLSGSGRLDGRMDDVTLALQSRGAVAGRLGGVVRWWDRPLAWRATLSTDRAALRRVDPAWRATALTLELKAHGNGGDFTLEAKGMADDPQWGRWRVRVDGSKQGMQWRVPRLTLHGPGQAPPTLQAHADWRMPAGPASLQDIRLDAAWQHLAWPPGGVGAALRSPQGTLSLVGAADAYRIDGKLELGRGDMPLAHIVLVGRGDRHHLRLGEGTAATWLRGRWQAAGEVAWRPALSWQVQLSAEGVNPGAAWPRWPGHLAATLESRGSRKGGALEGRAVLKVLTGTLRGYPVQGSGGVALSPTGVELTGLSLRSGSARLSADGRVGRRWTLAWKLHAPDLAALYPGASGRVEGDGRITGPRAAPQVEARLQAGAVTVGGEGVQRLDLSGTWGLAADAPWRLELHAAGVSVGDLPPQRLALTVRGTATAHHATFDASGGHLAAHLALTGSYAGGRWHGTLAGGRIRAPTLGDWRQERPAAFTAGAGGGRLKSWCWASAPGRLCLDAARQKGGWRGDMTVQHLPLQRLGRWLPEGVALRGQADASAHVVYGARLTQLKLSAEAADGVLRYVAGNGQAARRPYQRLTLEVAGGAGGLAAHAAVRLDATDRAQASLSLPGWLPGRRLAASQPVSGRLEVSLADIAWIGPLLPQVAAPAGRLDGTLQLAGSLQAPRFHGRLDLDGGEVVVPAVGVQLRQVRLHIRPAAGRLLAFSGSARSGKGSVTVDGGVRAVNGHGWWLEAAVKGSGFEAVSLPEARVVASPDLRIAVSGRRVELSGRVTIPEADINLPKIPASASASPDVVVVDRPGAAPAPKPMTVKANVRVVFGDKVKVQGYGFSGRLTGALTVVQNPGTPPTGQGELQIVDGKYQAYGQNLTLTEARLLFADSPLDNPGVQARAERKVGDVTAGVAVSGRARSPQLSIFSDPAMGQSEALSYLLLGRPLSGASGQDANLLYQAALSLGLKGGDRLAKSIAGQFGLQTVQVESEPGNQQASLVLGKYLSPRLYLQYAVGLWNAADVLRIRWQWTKHWALQAESGAQSGADLLYTIER